MSKTKTLPAGSSKTERQLTFEEALKRLEDIVETLEKGNTPLKESIDLYEEGMTIGKSCLERLNEAKLRLKKIQKGSGGTIEEKDVEI